MEYSVAIRTLGTAGEKYQKLLFSLERQTLRPHSIIVYIAEGYPIPEETIGIERYVYVKKGMVAQRALQYDEVTTEYLLLLDDDLELQDDTVERMFDAMLASKMDVLAPDIYNNASRPTRNEIMMTLSGRMRPRFCDDKWGYKVMLTSGYSYRRKNNMTVCRSQTNAGAAFLCKKSDFLKINFEEEMWLDEVQYALGDDQAMYYKMHMLGLKVGTWYNHSFTHLDGGNHMTRHKERMLVYNDLRFKVIFWHRFIYSPERCFIKKVLSILSILYLLLVTFLLSLFKLQFKMFFLKYDALAQSLNYLKSSEYRAIPKVN